MTIFSFLLVFLQCVVPVLSILWAEEWRSKCVFSSHSYWSWIIKHLVLITLPAQWVMLSSLGLFLRPGFMWCSPSLGNQISHHLKSCLKNKSHRRLMPAYPLHAPPLLAVWVQQHHYIEKYFTVMVTDILFEFHRN